ncbi:MAG TPA: response regulator [Bryobacteraceae bacterium]|nr:response regulator [Bryobacteraceae bacterium]
MQMADSTASILLVDDEERDLDVIRDLLQAANYRVCTASSYKDAMRCMENLPYIPDLLITDIALPEVNGIELYRKFSHMTGVWMNVLFISAYSGAEILQFYGLPLSDVHFLAKPFSAEELRSRVKSLIDSPVPLRLAS